AVIDAAHHEVGTLRQERFDADHDAIRRRAVDLPPAIATLHGPHRMMQGERMAGRALLAVGRHHPHLAEGLGGSDQTLEAVRENAVVVRDEESQPSPSFPCSSRKRFFNSRSSESTVSRLSAARATVLRSPAFLCSSTFCRAPSIVYFSVYSRCFTSRI